MRHCLAVIAVLLLMAGLATAQATFTIVTGTETPIGLGNPGEVKCHKAVPTGNPFAPCPPGTSGTMKNAVCWIVGWTGREHVHAAGRTARQDRRRCQELRTATIFPIESIS